MQRLFEDVEIPEDGKYRFEYSVESKDGNPASVQIYKNGCAIGHKIITNLLQYNELQIEIIEFKKGDCWTFYYKGKLMVYLFKFEKEKAGN